MVNIIRASGSQAWRANALADGKGGLLAKGWWYRQHNTSKLVGPYSTEVKARKAWAADAGDF